MKNSVKIMTILMVLSLVIMSTTCVSEDEYHHHVIEMFNNSDKAIYAFYDWGYPDTLNAFGVPSSSEPSIFKVEPYKRNRTALWDGDHWEEMFGVKDLVPSDTLMVYVYDAELLDSHTTNLLNTIIQRYDLSLHDLRSCNWIITYPPTEVMRNVKMYPPYSNYIKK